MACFIVPAAEAVVTTVAEKVVRSKETKGTEGTIKIPFSTKMGWLNKMLWGGSALLAFEHLWHGEVVPFFPFLTAVQNGETAEMLAEMGSAGVGMAVLVTAAWGGLVAVSSVIEKRGSNSEESVKEA